MNETIQVNRGPSLQHFTSVSVLANNKLIADLVKGISLFYLYYYSILCFFSVPGIFFYLFPPITGYFFLFRAKVVFF